MQNTFDEFIEEKQRHHAAIAPVELAQRKEKWLASIEHLYRNISEWLRPYVMQGSIKVERLPMTLSEEQIGSYSVPQLKIYLVDTAVDIIPKGTYLVNACGRVDIEGRKGASMLIEKDWEHWIIANLPSPNGTKIRVNLTEQSFKDKLMKLAG